MVLGVIEVIVVLVVLEVLEVPDFLVVLDFLDYYSFMSFLLIVRFRILVFHGGLETSARGYHRSPRTLFPLLPYTSLSRGQTDDTR